MSLRCIIVDDELPSLDELSHLLTEIEGVDVLACADNGQKALTKIKELRPDVVFLDIKMPGMNGFDVAREILPFEPSPLIVFATAYDEYAIEAFDVKAIDYILKPFSKKRLEEHLKAQDFLRVHRSYLVNLSHIKDIVPWFNGKYLITMQDSRSKEITVSRNNVKILKNYLLFEVHTLFIPKMICYHTLNVLAFSLVLWLCHLICPGRNRHNWSNPSWIML